MRSFEVLGVLVSLGRRGSSADSVDPETFGDLVDLDDLGDLANLGAFKSRSKSYQQVINRLLTIVNNSR